MKNTIQLKVKRVIVQINTGGLDRVCLTLDGPTPFPDCGYDGNATIEVRAGYGVQWCKAVLGVEPEVMDIWIKETEGIHS